MLAPTWRPWVFAFCPRARRAASRRADDWETRDVAGGEDVVASTGAAAIVDERTVVDLEPGLFGELRSRNDAEPSDDHVTSIAPSIVTRKCLPVARDRLDLAPGPDVATDS